MMFGDVHEQLRALLDCHPIGFPWGPGVIEILRLLFSEEEAKVALGLTFAPLRLEQVSERAGVEPAWAAPRLESLADKALVFAQESKGTMRYALRAPLVILEAPYWKGVRDQTTEEVTELGNPYGPIFMEGVGSPAASLLRTIPIQEEIEQKGGVLPYDKIYDLVAQAHTAAVIPCSCREARGSCERDAPRESCMVFDDTATSLVERGFGRYVTRDEAKQIIRQCDEAGLVHQVSDVQERPFSLCACCPCCCGVLKARAEFGNRHIMTRSAFSPIRDPAACTRCRSCADTRCPVGAIEITAEAWVVDPDLCIGCGLCATGCQSDAIRMERTVKVHTPPANAQEWGLHLLKDHGRLEKFMELMTPRRTPPGET